MNELHTYIASANDDGADFCKYLKDLDVSRKYKLLKTTYVEKATAVHHAAGLGHTDLLKQMMKGLSKSQCCELFLLPNKQGDTVLTCAAQRGHEKAVRYILSCVSVSPKPMFMLLEMQGNHGDTVFHKAAYHGHVNVFMCVLENMKHPDKRYDLLAIKDNNKATALHRAASGGYTNLVEYILETTHPDKRYDLLAIQNVQKATALHNAASRGLDVVVKCLLKYADRVKIRELLSLKDIHGQTVRQAAKKSGSKQTESTLLETENEIAKAGEYQSIPLAA